MDGKAVTRMAAILMPNDRVHTWAETLVVYPGGVKYLMDGNGVAGCRYIHT